MSTQHTASSISAGEIYVLYFIKIYHRLEYIFKSRRAFLEVFHKHFLIRSAFQVLPYRFVHGARFVDIHLKIHCFETLIIFGDLIVGAFCVKQRSFKWFRVYLLMRLFHAVERGDTNKRIPKRENCSKNSREKRLEWTQKKPKLRDKWRQKWTRKKLDGFLWQNFILHRLKLTVLTRFSHTLTLFSHLEFFFSSANVNHICTTCLVQNVEHLLRKNFYRFVVWNSTVESKVCSIKKYAKKAAR